MDVGQQHGVEGRAVMGGKGAWWLWRMGEVKQEKRGRGWRSLFSPENFVPWNESQSPVSAFLFATSNVRNALPQPRHQNEYVLFTLIFTAIQ